MTQILSPPSLMTCVMEFPGARLTTSCLSRGERGASLCEDDRRPIGTLAYVEDVNRFLWDMLLWPQPRQQLSSQKKANTKLYEAVRGYCRKPFMAACPSGTPAPVCSLTLHTDLSCFIMLVHRNYRPNASNFFFFLTCLTFSFFKKKTKQIAMTIFFSLLTVLKCISPAPTLRRPVRAITRLKTQ